MSESESSESSSANLSDQELRDTLLWASRPCFLYQQEFRDCKSIKARFNQYFIYGETIDCSQWGKDYENCRKYEEKNDIVAGKALLDSEEERRRKRMRDHYNNDVWQKRTSPPKDWSTPLPEWFDKNNENSYLAIKSKELKDGVVVATKEESFCSVM
ncbi:UPF0545 protein C22orf39 homolog [Sergentomyia squamirostris]